MRDLFLCTVQTLFLTTYLYTIPDWTILNYIEADNNVSIYGTNNIKTMQKVGSNNNVNVIVQLDEISHKKTWRFKVIRGGIIEDASLKQDMGLNPEKELAEGVAWAFNQYPSTNFMLILWNHGNGILDEPKGYPRKHHRGILYDYANNTYLNNQQLERTLNTIHHQVLGKKIDLLGMDACLMSMLEVCYQIKDHAEFFVASENVEPVPGWNYQAFLHQLTQSPTKIIPQKLAEIIVNTYSSSPIISSRGYALSAIKLSETEAIVENLNNIVTAITKLAVIEPHNTRIIIEKSRDHTLDFYSGKYMDLNFFYKNLIKAFTKKQGEEKENSSKKYYTELINLLTQGESLIKKAVFMFGGRGSLPWCGGLSIYYPRSKGIHPSYPLTKFAKNSSWLAFIKEYSSPSS